jgi:methyl-accepting chemotaxis protein
MRIGNLRVKTKIMLVALLQAITVLIVAIAGLLGLYELVDSYSRVEESRDAAETALTIQKTALRMDSLANRYQKTGKKEFLDSLAEAETSIPKELKSLEALLHDERDQRNVLARAREAYHQWRLATNDRQAATPGKEGTDDAKSRLLTMDSGTAGLTGLGEFITTLASITERERVNAQKYLQVSEDLFRTTVLRVYVGVPFVILLILVILPLYLYRSVAAPVERAKQLMDATSRGDLSQTMEVGNKDEVGRLASSVNKLIENLRKHSQRIFDGVNVLASSTAEISATSSQLSDTASRTAAAVAQTSATAEELKQAAHVSSNKASTVRSVSQKTVQVSEAGKKATERTVQNMNLIRDKMGVVGDTVVRLTEHAQDIEDTISIVKYLADQSNLLAVNASIQAAVAGEHGKGFSVVAHEIKSLSDSSRDATDRVSGILKKIRESVSEVVMSAEQGIKAVDIGVEQSVLAGESIGSLAQGIVESSQAAEVIAASSEQQFSGVDQVAQAMKSIEAAMNANLEGTIQLNDEARRLEELGRALKELVQHFRF